MVVPSESYLTYAGNSPNTYSQANAQPVISDADVVDNLNNSSSSGYELKNVANHDTVDTRLITFKFAGVEGSDTVYKIKVDGADLKTITVPASSYEYLEIDLGGNGLHNVSYSMEYTSSLANGGGKVITNETSLYNINVVESTAIDSTWVNTQADNTFASKFGGVDTVIYQLLDNPATTEVEVDLGHDIWTGFGKDAATGGKDIIDVKSLLASHSVDASTLGNYIKVNKVGNDTVLSLDYDGSATNTKYAPTAFLTLKDVDTTLTDLLANGQIIY